MGRGKNKIDEREAELIGQVLTCIGHEIDEANSTLRRRPLEKADTGEDLSYHTIDQAEAEYTMKIELGVESDGVGRKRESEVTVRATYNRHAPKYESAPFNILFGLVAPAERSREAVLELLSDKAVSDTAPILTLTTNTFWVIDEQDNYYVVNTVEGTVRTLESVQDIKDHLRPMLTFLRNQMKKMKE